MSVLIEGMPIPKDCTVCPFRMIFGCFEYTNEQWNEVSNNFEGKRINNCPLKDVPSPHGRLIDGDALAEKFDYQGWIETAISIEHEPTIIEPEG